MLGLTWISIEGRSASPCRTSIKIGTRSLLYRVTWVPTRQGVLILALIKVVKLAERRRGTAASPA